MDKALDRMREKIKSFKSYAEYTNWYFNSYMIAGTHRDRDYFQRQHFLKKYSVSLLKFDFLPHSARNTCHVHIKKILFHVDLSHTNGHAVLCRV